MKSFLNILVMVFFSQIVNAQFPSDGDYQSVAPPPTPALPNYGQSVIDNSMPSPIEITRVTESMDYVDNNGDPQVWYPTHEYAKTQVWNADQTLYKVSSWKVFDATTYEEVQELSSMYPSFWSNTDPDVVWSFRETGEVKKFNVSTNTPQTVAIIPGYEHIKLGPGEGSIDKEDHYVALVGKKTNGDLDVIIFNLQTFQVENTITLEGAWGNGGANFPVYIDWVSISQSGNYVVINWTNGLGDINNFYVDQDGMNHYGVEVYNRADMQFQNRIIPYGNHGDIGYAVDGDEVYVQFYGEYGGGTIYMHKLDGSGSTVISTHSDIGISGHISCRNINRPGWAYVTESELAQSGQIIAVKLDDSGVVEHFGHHFSSALSYEQAAMAVASPNGDIICFKSDFGTDPTGGSPVAYSFFAKIPTPGQDFVLKAFLEGSYDQNTQWMNNTLNAIGEIPLQEPYTALEFMQALGGGGESTTQAVLDVAGGNAIVDWVLVELRSAADASVIIATRAALLQRDGDVVEVDGISPVHFSAIPADNFFVSIRHRNHFGVRSLNTFTSNNPVTIDFTNAATAVFGDSPMSDIGEAKVMIAGDANSDGQINALDKNDFWRVENGNPYNYINTKSDFNMDGTSNAIDVNELLRVNNGKTEQLE